MQKKENISNIRHSLSHLLATAVLEFYPDAKTAFGPPTDTGFYYDFDFGKDTVSESDFIRIEKRMKKLLLSFKKINRKEVSEKEARKYFKDNPYKLELIDEIVDKKEPITFYTSGNFTDLCEGGHTDDLSEISPESFTLSHIAGAYWRGNEKNKMLTRIYGLAFKDKKELQDHKALLEEAKKRDHRKIGKEMDLFTFSDLVGPGLPLWTQNGTAMRNAIIKKIRTIQRNYGYEDVTIPHITKFALYEKSGHAEKFGDELFKVKGKESEFALKPMNCPHHTQIYAGKTRSYKDLPLCLSETTMVYRDEQSGELLGLSRVRSITQDDGHVFCTPEQAKQEMMNIVEIIKEFYTTLGMYKEGNFKVSLSVRDPNNHGKYIGSDKQWQEAEGTLKKIAKEKHFQFEMAEGEAAFYGPKLDFMFKDAIGREWQLSTIQLDFAMPERFKLVYTDKDGTKKTPVMIHRVIAGSLERFISIIIEHFAGVFPFWMSPVQIKVLSIGEKHIDYTKKINEGLRDADFRSKIDITDENLSKKIKKVKEERIPYFLVIGDNELKNKTVTLEGREGKVGEKTPEQLITFLKKADSDNS